jgi:hypothetical protein
VTKRPNAMRWPTLTTDDQMMHLVKGWLSAPKSKPVKDSGYYWSEVLDAFWSQLTDNCVVEITATDEVRGLVNSPSWRFRVFDSAPLGSTPSSVAGPSCVVRSLPIRPPVGCLFTRKEFLCWVEDRIRTPSKPLSLTDKDLQRWLAVTEAHREGESWDGAYEEARKRLDEKTKWSVRDSYLKVQRMRRYSF